MATLADLFAFLGAKPTGKPSLRDLFPSFEGTPTNPIVEFQKVLSDPNSTQFQKRMATETLKELYAQYPQDPQPAQGGIGAFAPPPPSMLNPFASPPPPTGIGSLLPTPQIDAPKDAPPVVPAPLKNPSMPQLPSIDIPPYREPVPAQEVSPGIASLAPPPSPPAMDPKAPRKSLGFFDTILGNMEDPRRAALVKAGQAMATTPGSFVQGLTTGFGTAADYLEAQRKTSLAEKVQKEAGDRAAQELALKERGTKLEEELGPRRVAAAERGVAAQEAEAEYKRIYQTNLLAYQMEVAKETMAEARSRGLMNDAQIRKFDTDIKIASEDRDPIRFITKLKATRESVEYKNLDPAGKKIVDMLLQNLAGARVGAGGNNALQQLVDQLGAGQSDTRNHSGLVSKK